MQPTTLNNPFEALEQRLINIERFMAKLSQPKADQERQKDIINIDEASAEANLAVSTMYQYSSKGICPRIKTPKRVLFSREAIRQWVLAGMPDQRTIEAGERLSSTIKNRKQ